MKKPRRLLALLLAVVMLAALAVPALALDPLEYDGDAVNFIKADGAAFGMFTPQEGTTCVLSGDNVVIHYVPKNTTVYNGLHWGAIDDAELTKDLDFNADGTFDITLPKTECGKAVPAAPLKPDGGTTSAQYYLAIPAEEKLPVGPFPYDGDALSVIKADGSAMGMLAPQEGSTVAIDGDNVVIHLIPKNTTTYTAIYFGAIDDEGKTRDVELANGAYDITLPKTECGKALPIAPLKPNGDTTSSQYYLAIPSEDKLAGDPIAEGTYALPGLAAGPSAMFNHFEADSKKLTVSGDSATISFITDGSTASIQKYSRIALGKSSDYVTENYQATLPEGVTVIEGVLQPKQQESDPDRYLFEITLPKTEVEGLLANDVAEDIYIIVWNKVGSSEQQIPGWYKPSSDIYLSLGALGDPILPPEPIELTITNNTGMFKAVTATLETDENGEFLVFALSGTGYHYIFKGTYEQAVENGDATDNWIAGAENADGKWEFRLPVAPDESYIPVVAISQSYYQKYLNGQNSLERAFYPRQMELDREAKTLVTGDYERSVALTVTNNVESFPVSAAALETVGGPNSNNYKAALTLTMGSDSFDAAYVGPSSEIGADTTLIEPANGSFELPVKWVETFGRPETLISLLGDTFTVSFRSGDAWTELFFTVDEAAATLTISDSETPPAPGPVELTITNNTSMFKAVTATLETDENGEFLVFALSGTGYHYIFKGTYEQAVENGDATNNWIAGALNADGKWEFRLPVAPDESYIPVVAISQSYYDKYLNGQNSLERAFYPRQMELDREAKTLVTGDYERSVALTVTNNVSMFKVTAAALETVGGPNSNNYKSDLVLTMGSTSYDKAYVGPSSEIGDDSQTIALGEGNVFEIPVKWVETFGQPETLQNLLDGTFVISFRSANNGSWYERYFTVDEAAATLVIDKELADYSAVDEAIAAVPADLSVYTDETAAAVTAAVEAVERGLPSSRQAEVDAMAAAINEAVANLVLKPEEPPVPPTPVRTDLTVVNTTTMFKGLYAYVDDDGSSKTLTVALTGSTYHYLYRGNYAQAVANGDNRSAWLTGQQDSDGKWFFTMPISANDTYIPVVSISQTYLDKYEAGENPLERAFYPRQFELDLNAKTITIGDYDETTTFTVSSSVDSFKVASTATVRVIGGPNSNNFAVAPTLKMLDGTYDQVTYPTVSGNAIGEATAALTNGEFAIDIHNAPNLAAFQDKEPIAMKFRVAATGEEVELKLTVDLLAKTITVAGENGGTEPGGDDPAQPGSSGFVDVPDGMFYSEAVAWAVDKGITTGTTETTFEPDQPCNRGQVVTFLWRAAGKPAAEAANPFTDVAEGSFYYDAVLWAVANGITTGTTATTFEPDAPCTRDQVVTFLWRAAGKPAAEGTNPFTDVAEGSFYYDAVLWAVANGITTGTSDTTFSPAEPCTRGQVVTFLWRELK